MMSGRAIGFDLSHQGTGVLGSSGERCWVVMGVGFVAAVVEVSMSGRECAVVTLTSDSEKALRLNSKYGGVWGTSCYLLLRRSIKCSESKGLLTPLWINPERMNSTIVRLAMP